MEEKKYNGGFTVAEMLLTVAILGILAGVSFVNVVGMQRSMNQLQADKMARVLFQDAEQRMNEISAYDELLREELSDDDDIDDVDSMLNDGKGSKRDPKLRYLKQAKGETKNGYLKKLDLSSEYDGFQYVIEYQPETLDVTGVFVTESQAEFYAGRDAIDGLRTSAENRMAYVKTNGYYSPIGYYGKAVDEAVQSVPVINASPIVCDASFEDGEELKAVFHAIIPDNKEIDDISANGYYVHVTVESVDAAKVAAFRASIPPTAFTTDGGIFTQTREAEFSITIDGAGNDAFKKTFGQVAATGHTVKTSIGGVAMGGTSTTELSIAANTVGPFEIKYDGFHSKGVNFVPGENLVITAYAEPIPAEGEGTQKSEKESATANSLFASASLESNVYRAEIANVRHLQNLDVTTSGFAIDSLDSTGGASASSMTAAVTENIHVAEVNEDGTVKKDANGDIVYKKKHSFTSIANGNLTAFDGGKNYSIEGLSITPRSGEAAGLFSAFGGTSMQNVTITGCVVNGASGQPSGGLIGEWTLGGDATLSGCTMQGVRIVGGSNVGGLVGNLSGNDQKKLTISDCGLFMRSSEDVKALTDKNSDGKIDANDATDWLSGAESSGGLIGSTTTPLTISSSYAATVVNGGTKAGGLVGSADSTKIDVSMSYADCYISAKNEGTTYIGGLAGSCADTSTFTSCYSAGFVLNPTESTVAAKFVPNKYITTGDIPVDREKPPAAITKSYSYFSFYDITKASAKRSETKYEGNTVWVDSDVPNYDDLGDDVVYCVTADGAHRIDNGFGQGETDLSDMKYAPSGEQGECYNLARYFQDKGGPSTFTGAQAGLPHYGDFYDEPDEYRVTIVNKYDDVNEEQTMVYRSTGAYLLDDLNRENWLRAGYDWRYYTKDNEGKNKDEYIIGTQPQNMIYGYLQRGDFTRSGEGLWTITRYIKWEPTYLIKIHDNEKKYAGLEFERYFSDYMSEYSLEKYMLDTIIPYYEEGYENMTSKQIKAISYDAFVSGDYTDGKELKKIKQQNGDKSYTADNVKSKTLASLINEGWFDENNDVVIELVWEDSKEASEDGE